MVAVTDDGPGTAVVPDVFDAYAAGRVDARFTDWLRERTEPDWTAATTHRFARELGGGVLDDEVFRRYLVQDYAFIEALVGAFGHAVGEAPSMAAKSWLVDFLGVLTADEDDYFERSFDALDVQPETYDNPDLTPATRAFTDLLERAARQGGYAETLAVLTSAEWTYLEWATTAADGDAPTRFYLSEWVDLHTGEGFADVVAWLRDELDREGAAASARRQRRLARLFRRAVELEATFFDAAYDPEGTVPGGGRQW